MTIKRRTMAVLGLATVLAGGAGSGMAYASGTGSAPARTPTLTAVPGAKPDLAKVQLAKAIPLGKVTGIVSGGTTTTATTTTAPAAPAAPGAPAAADAPGAVGAGPVTLQAVPGAKPDLSKVVPGVAIPLGPVPHTGGSGTTAAR